jgi:squalene synthase HpnC
LDDVLAFGETDEGISPDRMPLMPRWPEPLSRAYAMCERMAQSHYENFPVASRLLPAPMRPHVAAVYAFARAADDFADEGTAVPAVRLAQLRGWQERLHESAAAAAGHGKVQSPVSRDDLLFLALGHSIRSLELPVRLFDDLLSAFGQDTTTLRYQSWSDVLDYCRRSANPIGRLVLRIAGYKSDALDRSSDALCTALQLTNFWQDFGRDWRAGRLYVPREVQELTGASEADLDRQPLPAPWGRAIEVCVATTRTLFDEGREVCDGVSGRLKLELRFTWLGGRQILERVQVRRADLSGYRPTLGAADVPLLLWRAVRWRRGG